MSIPAVLSDVYSEGDMTGFLFDSSGNWIAFRRNSTDKFIFGKDGNWIGWLPWNDAEVVDKDGKYLGTIVGNRLVAFGRPSRGYPGYPGYAGYPGYPGFAGYKPLPPGASDVRSFKKP